MEQAKDKKRRDWLGAWTILVLPGLFLGLSFFIQRYFVPDIFEGYGRAPSEFMVVLFVLFSFFSAPLFLLLAILYACFKKVSHQRNPMTIKVLVLVDGILTIVYFACIANILIETLRPRCTVGDLEHLDQKPWCAPRAL